MPKGKIEVIEVKQVEKTEELVLGYSRINEGEAEALILAQEKSIQILLTDDFRSLPDLKNVSEDVEIVTSFIENHSYDSRLQQGLSAPV